MENYMQTGSGHKNKLMEKEVKQGTSGKTRSSARQ